MASTIIDLNLNPDDRTLKWFGFVSLGAFGLLAYCALRETWMFSCGLGEARTPLAIGLAWLALVPACASIFRPRANRCMYVGISVLAYPLGLAVSYLIMGLLFFGLLAPTGAVLRMHGKDPLQRKVSPDRRSYWVMARPRRSKRSYLRQF